MSDLQDALDHLDETVREGYGVPPVIVDAAKRWTAVQEAITNEGPHPSFHRKVMRKHKEEWPTLWAALITEDTDET